MFREMRRKNSPAGHNPREKASDGTNRHSPYRPASVSPDGQPSSSGEGFSSLREQFRQGGEAVAHLLPAGEQFVEDFPVGLRSGVQQHHRPVMGPGQQLGESLLRCGLGIVVPIHIGQAPENRLVAHGLGLLQVLLAVNPLGAGGKIWKFPSR